MLVKFNLDFQPKVKFNTKNLIGKICLGSNG